MKKTARSKHCNKQYQVNKGYVSEIPDKIEIAGVTYYRLKDDALPPLTNAELKRLIDDIRQRGVWPAPQNLIQML